MIRFNLKLMRDFKNQLWFIVLPLCYFGLLHSEF